MNILIFWSTFALFFLEISTLCLYPFWKSLSLSNSSYSIAFSFSLITNLFFRLLTSKVKFPIFRITIAMVWNDSIALFALHCFCSYLLHILRCICLCCRIFGSFCRWSHLLHHSTFLFKFKWKSFCKFCSTN
jgi:hypothetical protein